MMFAVVKKEHAEKNMGLLNASTSNSFDEVRKDDSGEFYFFSFLGDETPKVFESFPVVSLDRAKYLLELSYEDLALEIKYDIPGTVVRSQPPFAEKTIPGFKLYRRVHGQTATLSASGTTEVSLVVPYSLCKIDEVQMYWFPEGVVSDFTVEHPTAGVLSQHGFTVPVAKDYAEDSSAYDATLQAGLILKLTFTNQTDVSKQVGVAFVLHEMVAL